MEFYAIIFKKKSDFFKAESAKQTSGNKSYNRLYIIPPSNFRFCEGHMRIYNLKMFLHKYSTIFENGKCL